MFTFRALSAGTTELRFTGRGTAPPLPNSYRPYVPLTLNVNVVPCTLKHTGRLSYLRALQLDAERRGQRSGVFRTSRASAACLWSTALARKFRRAGAGFDAIGVVGCESAVRTVSQVFPDKPVVQLVRVEGIANFTLRTAWPLTVEITAAAQIPREGIHGLGGSEGAQADARTCEVEGH